jgi:Domain of unknown function (DUF4139)/N-terminal domain of unknown function (DUF4140)
MSTALSSRIHEVTVFRQGARVVRVAELPAEPAKRVRLVRLPLTLDDGSIRARIEGEGTATDLRVTLEVPPASEALAPPKDEELLAAQLDMARLRAEVERVTAMIARVQSIAILARPKGKEGEPPPKSPIDARRAVVTLRTEEQARLAAELASLERELLFADRKHASLRERAAHASTARNPKEHELWKSVVVTLDGAAKGLLHLEYMVPGARWSPSYSVALAGAGKSAQLTMRAAVAQRTGEDWAGANLVLSTADAEKWTELPVLKSVRIGRAQRGKPPRGWREPPVGALELYADYDRAFGPPRPSARDAEDFLSRSVSDDDVTRVSMARTYDDENTPVEDMHTIARGTPGMERMMARGSAAFSPPPAHVVLPAMSVMPPQSFSAAPHAPQGMARPAARGGGGMLAGIGDAFGAVLGSGAAAAPMPKSRKASESGAVDELAPEEEAPPPAGLDLEALAYGRMRMLAPTATGRGALIAASAASMYMEALGVAVSVDVLAIIRVAVQRASLGDSALPPGHEPIARSNDFDYAYVAAGAVNVPSDGVFHVLPLGAHQAESRLHHVAVPRETQDVFRVLELTSPLDAALPRGPIDVYLGGNYLMTSRLPPTPPRGKLRLGLGVEQAIKIARNTTFAEKSTGLLGGGLSLVHEIDVDVQNATDRPVELEVRERLPVKTADDKDVEVVVETVEPAWKEWTQEQTLEGGYKWTISVDPGQKRKLFAKYVVKLSSKQELAGGNRREA